MTAALRSLTLRLLRVPPRPQPPAGDTGPVLTFHASRRYFHYKVAIWAMRQLGALIALVGGTLFLINVAARSPELARFTGWRWIELWAWTVFIAQLPFSYMLLRLDFEMRWYILADRSLRIREGTLVMREKTMSYANIQNISIRRNPLQRIFGLATVAVRAAGGGSGASEHKGGGSGSHTHEAMFEGVDNADEIRSILRERIRRYRDSGLGDPDDVYGDEGAPPVLAAARNLLDEARALRTATG